MKQTYTREDKVREIIRCGKDPIHFINEYVHIQHPARGRILFKTYDFQNDIISALINNRFNVVLKSRQLGLSTIAAAYATWLAIFHKDKNILVIATKLDTAINFIKKVKVALETVPDWLLLPKYDNNKRSVNFSNGSQITAIPTSEDAGRSEALSLLIVDEAAFIRNFEDIWTGLFPTISTGGAALVISTPNGVGGMYYKLCIEAESGHNGFNLIKLPWWLHPDHDDAWFFKETKNLPRRKVAQEFLCEFNASGDTFLQADDLAYLRDEIRTPIAKKGFDNNVWIWKEPIPGHKYVITADVARGDASDYSTFHILDADECEVVAEYMGKIPPEKLALLIEEWGHQYNDALACPENNSFGYFTCVTLRDRGYPHIFYDRRKYGGDIFAYTPPDPDKLPGFSTQGNTRPQILAKLEETIRNKVVKIYSQRLYNQLQSFVWYGSKPTAQKDSHDDLIISLAIAVWLVGPATAQATSATALAQAMLKSISRESSTTKDLFANVNLVKPINAISKTSVAPQVVFRPRETLTIDDSSASDIQWLLN